MRRFLMPGLLVAALLVGAAFYIGGDESEERSYRFADVEQGPIVSAVGAAGSVKLPATVVVAAKIPGQVAEILADFNTPVRQGQILARLQAADPQLRQAMAEADLMMARGSVRMAAAALEQVRSRVDTARAGVQGKRAAVSSAEQARSTSEEDLALKRKMAASGDIASVETQRASASLRIANSDLSSSRAQAAAAAAEFAAAEAAVDVAEAELQNAEAAVAAREAALRQAQMVVEQAAIQSPIDGIVLDRPIVVGQQVQEGTALFTVASDLRSLQVHANVDEADVGRIAVGQKAVFAFDAYPGQSFFGSVADIRKLPVNNQGVVTYTVVIDADNSNLKLFPGMTTSVQITVAQRDNVVKIPRAALRFVPAGENASPGQERVWRLSADDKPTPIVIKTGITDAVFAEVIDGELRSGDKLIVGASRSEQKSPSGPFRF